VVKKKYVLLEIIDNLSVGGGENMLSELIKHMDFSRYKVFVVCYGPKLNTHIEKKVEQICEVIYLSITHSITPRDMVKVMREISKINPDIVHSHLGGITFGLPWCLLHKKPFVVTAHTVPQQAFSKKNEKLLRYGLRRKKALLVAVSKENQIKCKDYYGVDDRQCVYVNNGVDANRFYKKEHDAFTFINVARQDENKNQLMILRCFQNIYKTNKHIKLILVGDGPKHKELQDFIAENDLENAVVLPGMTDLPEEYYAVSDVYVQSSRREAMPLSVLEALTVGLPVLSTDVGGLRDIVKENGYLVPVDDQEQYEKRMMEFLQMAPEKMADMQNKSKEISKDFTSSKMAERYMELFHRELGDL